LSVAPDLALPEGRREEMGHEDRLACLAEAAQAVTGAE
jgi:hypothetical protein